MALGGGDVPAFVPATEEEIIAGTVLSKSSAVLGQQKGPFLMELVADARNGNAEDLREGILYLKAGLAQKEVSLADVVKGEDLIPLLIRGLKSKQIPVFENASWIICEIIAKGTPAQREKVMVGEGAAIYPIFLKMLSSSEDKIWQHSLNTLVWIFDKERSRPQLRDPAIIPAITKLAEKTAVTHHLRNVYKVACFFGGCFEDDFKAYPLTLDSVRKLVALYKILYRKTEDNQTTTDITQSLFRFIEVEGGGKAIISGGILPWVVGHLSHSCGQVRSAVILIIEELVGRKGSIVVFFKALMATEGMKVFYKSVRNSIMEIRGEGTVDMKKVMMTFFTTVNDALDDSALKTELISAILESGFVESLVKCLEEEETPAAFTLLAITILAKLTKGVDPGRLGSVIEAGAVPLLVKLLSSSHKPVRWLAIACLGQGNLIKSGPKMRDEVIQQGGIDKLIGLVEGEGRNELSATLLVLQCFEDLLATTPRVGLDKYEKLSDCLKGLLEPVMLAWYVHSFKDEGAFGGKVLVSVFRCVDHLIAHGKDGLELVEKKGFLDKMIELLPWKDEEAQRVALETMVGTCKADEKYVPVLIRKGILEYYELLCHFRGQEFASSSGVFMEYLMKGLTPGQRFVLDKIAEKEQSALAEMFKALRGSADPVAVLKAKIDEVLSRQAGLTLSVS